MTLSEIDDYGYTPDQFDLTNYFTVEERMAGNGSVLTFFNLNDGVAIDGIEDVVGDGVKRYVCRSGDNLRFVSYREYGSIHYWWMIAKINGIRDAFEELDGGRVLYLLPKEYMNYIMRLALRKEDAGE